MLSVRFWKEYFSFMRPSIWPAIIAAGGAILGGLISRSGQQETNASNAFQAQEQMQFQERMSNTAHQREVADLRNAGLNPILSGTGGAGSTTPAGAMARMENPDAALGEAMGNSARSFNETRLADENVKNLKETNTLLRVQQDQTKADAALKSVDYNLRLKDVDMRAQQIKTEEEKTKAAMHEASILSNSAKGAELEGEIDETRYGALMRYIDRAVKSITGGSGAIRAIKP